jgi:hypothetical protein
MKLTFLSTKNYMFTFKIFFLSPTGLCLPEQPHLRKSLNLPGFELQFFGRAVQIFKIFSTGWNQSFAEEPYWDFVLVGNAVCVHNSRYALRWLGELIIPAPVR